MIFTPILLAIYQLLIYILDTLPSMNQDVLDKIYSAMNMFVPKFVALGYYYLPMAEILFWVQIYIGVWLTVFTVKLLIKIVSIMTVGVVGVDKL